MRRGGLRRSRACLLGLRENYRIIPSRGESAAMLAMVTCGVFRTVGEAAESLIEISSVIAPDAELTARYEMQYQKFRRIFPALKPTFPAIL